jgi:aminoglycoside phosphotransferase family enzyme/predicted kinase
MGGQAETLAFLRAALEAEQGAPVEIVETHISDVLLAGERAWKLKRAVKLPYLDFSTPERRRAAAEDELALNRRAAPQLYLGLREIRRDAAGRLHFGETGELVDVVVEMRRFDQASLFDRLARADALTRPLLTALAREIARFHATADVVRGAAGAGSIAAVLALNARALADSGLVAPDAATAQTARFKAAFARLAPLLDARGEAGRIRRCHGDLNLRNICLYEGAPVLFDCLEFDARLAEIDVLYDLAFLLMDLWEHGRAEQANWTLNRYLDVADETEGLALLPFFMAMRAAIRAHVTATQAKEHPERRAEALAYHALADDLLIAHAPRLVAIGGLSGTGKSTLAHALAHRLGAAPGARVLSSDRLRKALAGVSPETRLPAQAYARAASDAVYADLMARAAHTLASGGAVVADAVFAAPAERAAIAEIARQAGVAFTGLWLESDPAVMRANVAARVGDPSDATVEVVERQLGYDLGTIDWTRLDADADDLLARAAVALT